MNGLAKIGFLRTLRTAACVLVWVVIGSAAQAFAATADEDFAKGEKTYYSGDVVGAIGVLRRAADAGHGRAQALLAEILDAAEYNEEAVAYFRKAALQGAVEGEFGLALMYLKGEGVQTSVAQAVFWLLRAAEKSHRASILTLAQVFLRPVAAGATPLAEAATVVKWLRRAADVDDLAATEALAGAYRSGAFGLTPDEKEAERWTTRALALKKRLAPVQRKKKQ